MARCSIVVPLLGKNSSFEETLASVLRYRPDNTQVIVPHRGPYQDSYGLGKEVEFVEAKSQSRSEDGLIEMFNAGVKAARGKWIAFLRPGVQLTEKWDEPVEAGFASADVASVTPIIVSASDPNRIITAGVQVGAGFARGLVGVDQELAKKKRGLIAAGPTAWGAFYRRSLLVSLDECDVHLGSNYFDLDLALSFSSLDFGNVCAQNCVLTCSEAESKELLEEASSQNGCSAGRAMIRFAGLVSTKAPPSMVGALLRDLFSGPWKWQNLRFLKQRRLASKYKLLDKHYRGLLSLLYEQRERLVSPGLHAHVAAKQRSISSGRKAA